jgi:hypothetical protein
MIMLLWPRFQKTGRYRKNGRYKTVSAATVTVFSPFNAEKQIRRKNAVTAVTEQRYGRETPLPPRNAVTTKKTQKSKIACS